MSNFRKPLLSALTFVTVCVGVAQVTPAEPVILTGADRGWFDSSVSHDVTNKNYSAGTVPLVPGIKTVTNNNFSVSNLSNVSAAMTSAQLQLSNAVAFGSGQYLLSDAGTSPLASISSQSGRTDLFSDRGTSAAGAKITPPSDFMTETTIDLNEQASAAIQSSAADVFAVGGFFDTGRTNDTPAFGSEDMTESRNQWRHHPRPVPEPATLLLLGSGLLGVAAKLRRRRAVLR